MPRPPILLLHGWGGSFASTFADNGWLDALASRRLLSLPTDLPGHGEAPATRDPGDYADLAGTVASGFPSGGLDIVGYSLGAKIALELAVRFPDKIRRMALLGVGDNAFVPEPSAAAVIDALEHGVTGATPEAAVALVDYSRASGSDPKALAAVLRRPPNPIAREDALAGLGQRTLLINGQDDRIAQPDTRLRSALDGLTYVLLTATGHIALPRDEAVRNTCIAFLTAADERDVAMPQPRTESNWEKVRGIHS